MEYKNSQYKSIVPSYLENTLLKPRPFYHTGIEESLENIVLKEEHLPERGIIDKVFSDKSRNLKAIVKAFFNEILLRERLDTELLGRINDDLCRTGSYLEEIRTLTRRDYLRDLTLGLSRRRTQLESRLIDLEKEKRQEYLTCWKDLMFLKRYLLFALKDYWNLSNKKSFLEMENDEPGYRDDMQEAKAYNWQ